MKLARGQLSKEAVSPRYGILDETLAILLRGRGYAWVAIYLVGGDASEPKAAANRGPALKAAPEPTEAPTKTVVPIRIASHILGALEVEPGLRPFGSQDRALLKRVAVELARFLTTNSGRLLRRKVREEASAARTDAAASELPQEEAGLARTAAAHRSV